MCRAIDSFHYLKIKPYINLTHAVSLRTYMLDQARITTALLAQNVSHISNMIDLLSTVLQT